MFSKLTLKIRKNGNRCLSAIVKKNIVFILVSFVMSFAVAAAIDDILTGFDINKNPLSSRSLDYVSFTQERVESFHARASTGKEFVKWESEIVPEDHAGDMVKFIIPCGFGVSKSVDVFFGVYLNDKKLLEIKPEYSPEMSWRQNGVEVSFKSLYLDRHSDLFGVMFIKVPVRYIEKGETAKFRVVGREHDSKAWFMLSKVNVDKNINIEKIQRENNITVARFKELENEKKLLTKIKHLEEFKDYHPRHIPSAHVDEMEGQTKELHGNWRALNKRNLSLLPVPKKIEFIGKPVKIEDIAIVMKNKTEQGDIAVNEIISRIKELSGTIPGVYDQAQDDKVNIIIKNHFPNFFSDSSDFEKKF